MEKKMMMNTLILGGSLLLAASCGNDNNKSLGSSPMKQPSTIPETGVYKATLRSINPKVASNINGTATITINKGEFYAQVEMINTPSLISHAQYIHAEDNCPSEDNDVNKDGFIDATEAGKSYGPALVALDGDLKSHNLDTPMFPVADGSGNYLYRDWASVDELLATLRSNVVSPGMVKLGAVESLNLGKRSVVIYGVAADTSLPETVATTGQNNKQETFPIACGSIVKVSDDVIKY